VKKLSLQRKIAARLLGVGENRIWLDPTKLKEISEAVTSEDIRKLIKKGIISARPVKGTSRARARERHEQRKKGRRRGIGKRKGKRGARTGKKERWVNTVRKQRRFLKFLKKKRLIDKKLFEIAYRKIKGGEFKSLHHLKLFLEKELGEKKWR